MTRVLLMMMAGLLVSSCGLGSGSSSDESDIDDSGRDRNDEAQPAGTEPDAVAPYISEMLLAYDRLMGEINADPGIANDPDDSRIQELVGLFELDEGVEEDWLEGWVEQAAQGVRTVPVSEDYPALTTTLDGEMEGVSEDEVRFPICVVTRSREIREDGDSAEDEGVSGVPRFDQPGVASAVRVDGEWLLRAFDVSEQEFGCRSGEAGQQEDEPGRQEGEESGD